MGQGVVETYWSSDQESLLLSIRWNNVADQDALWTKLREALTTVEKLEHQLGAVSGRLPVVLGVPGVAHEDSVVEEWPVMLGANQHEQTVQALERRFREAIASGATSVMPKSAPLSVDAFVFLPPGVERVELVNFDLPDLIELGPLPLHPASYPGASTEGYTRWQTIASPGEEETALYLEISGELSDRAQVVTLRVCSRLDFFRPKRFDGEPNGPHGVYNLRHLHTVFSELARQTAGRILLRESLV